MAAIAVTLKVIHQLQAFLNAIRQTLVQHFTVSTNSVLVRFLSISRASYLLLL